MKKFRYPLGIVLCLLIIFIGPWPAYNPDFKDSDYEKHSLQDIDNLQVDRQQSQILAGYAKKDVTPPINSPIGGYSAREPKLNTGNYEHVFVKAITVQNQEHTITIVNSETLLPLPELVNKVTDQTGLNRNDIYFTSTHTHSGPGGYATGLVESETVGPYSAEYTQFLTDSMTEVIIKSRSNLVPASLNYTNAKLKPDLTDTFIYNQLQDGINGHNALHVLRIVSQIDNNNIATLVTFSAHPTFFGRQNTRISGDYPSLLMTKLESALGGGAIFIPGAVGGMIPLSEGHKPSKEPELSDRERREFTDRLLEVIQSALANDNKIGELQQHSFSRLDINSYVIPVKLPSPNYRISDSFRLSPFMVEQIFHGTETYIQVLKLGNIMLLAYPADYSGELAAELETYATTKNSIAWITCFNGDYIGYLSPSKYYSLNHYITRDANIFGKYTGDYFNTLSKSIIDKLN